MTYGALLRQAVPDLKQDGDTWKGTKLAHYRHLLGKDYDNGEPYAPFHGRAIHVPQRLSEHPHDLQLRWHNETKYLG